MNLLPKFAILVIALNSFANPPALCAQENQQLVPDSAFAVVVAYPQEALSQPALDLFPREIVTASGMQQFGIDPIKISQIVLLLGAAVESDGFQWGAIVRFAEDTRLGGRFADYADPQEVNGRKTYSLEPGVSLTQINQTTFLIGSETMLAKMSAADSNANSLTAFLAEPHLKTAVTAFVDMRNVRALMKNELSDFDLPRELKKFELIPEQIETIRLTQHLNIEMQSQLSITATDGNAQELTEVIAEGLNVGKELIFDQMTTEMRMNDPFEKSTALYAFRVGEFVQRQLTPTINGNEITYEANYGIAAVPAATALIMPAVHAIQIAGRRYESANNIRQLMIAMHNFHDSNQKLPTNIYDEDGKALLSWRVQILPYIEEYELYEEFDLTQPWDSEHNLKLVDRMPASLKCPGVSLEDGKTIYLAFAGEGTVFDGPEKKTLEQISNQDGTSTTLAVVEANPQSAVIWTQPADLQVDFDNPLNGLGGIRREGFNAATYDAAIHLIPETIDPETLKLLIQNNDGVDPGFDWYR